VRYQLKIVARIFALVFSMLALVVGANRSLWAISQPNDVLVLLGVLGITFILSLGVVIGMKQVMKIMIVVLALAGGVACSERVQPRDYWACLV
jgi:hypothetical protein